MVKLAEATEKNGKISLNTWTRLIVSILWGVIFAIVSTLVTTVNANDHKSRERDDQIKEIAMENRAKTYIIEAKLDAIIENQREFKQLLKRTIPRSRDE